MANESIPLLDPVFAALADPTRRAVIEALGEGPAPVSALAAPHDMALPSFLKHIDKLQAAGLVTTRKEGRQRICTLRPQAMRPLRLWLAREEARWRGALARLDMHLTQIEKEPRQ